MAIEIHPHGGRVEVHISVTDLHRIINVLGGPDAIQLMRSEFCLLIEIWDALPINATKVRFQVSHIFIQFLMEVCAGNDIETIICAGDGAVFSPLYPPI